MAAAMELGPLGLALTGADRKIVDKVMFSAQGVPFPVWELFIGTTAAYRGGRGRAARALEEVAMGAMQDALNDPSQEWSHAHGHSLYALRAASRPLGKNTKPGQDALQDLLFGQKNSGWNALLMRTGWLMEPNHSAELLERQCPDHHELSRVRLTLMEGLATPGGDRGLVRAAAFTAHILVLGLAHWKPLTLEDFANDIMGVVPMDELAEFRRRLKDALVSKVQNHETWTTPGPKNEVLKGLLTADSMFALNRVVQGTVPPGNWSPLADNGRASALANGFGAAALLSDDLGLRL